jgi:glucosylceramidase
MLNRKLNDFRGNLSFGVCCLQLLLAMALPAMASWAGKARFSTQNALWANETRIPLVNSASVSNTIDIDTATTYQSIDGFGGCFNENGGKALKAVSSRLADSVMKELFDTVSGCKFNLCRMPIGASDFTIATATLSRWYSLNETVNDTAMNTITIARDKIYLLPFIKSAMMYRPNLKMWASPWSPPKWMKVNNDVGAANFIQTPVMLRAYARYLASAVRLFQAEGINLVGLSVQNEPYTNNPYPCCFWSASEIRDLIKLYVGPVFDADQVNCEIWSPTMNNGSFTEFNTWLSDQGSARYIKAVCFQWEGESAIASVHSAYPAMKLYLTETKCGSHENNWAYAENPTFQQMKWYFDRGANGYMQWNMVLDQTGLSAWGWAQCSMVTVDTTAKTVTFNPQHYCAKHFSYYVKPGAKKIKTSGTFSNQVGFRNPDGSVVVVANNTGTGALSLGVRMGAQMMNVQMPGKSFGTFVFYDSAGVKVSRPFSGAGPSGRGSILMTHGPGAGCVFALHGKTFAGRLVGIDGSVKIPALFSQNGSMVIGAARLARGMYILTGMLDNKFYCSTIFLR